jgi:protein TonB
MPKRKNRTPFLLLLLALVAAPVAVQGAGRAGLTRRFSTPRALSTVNDREQDGLVGPVRRVKTETAKITVKNGKSVEGPRAVLETITYDNKGGRVDSAYFLTAGGSLTGKEVYKYDDRGNIVEMTLQNEDGSLLAKETYTYEFDAVGNWVKMTTSVAVIEGGKLTFEPTEVTYRTIAYYLEEAMIAKMSQPAAQPSPAATSAGPPPASAAQPTPARTAANTPQPAPENAKPNTNTAANSPSNTTASPASNTAASNTTASAPAQKQPAPANSAQPTTLKPAEKVAEKPADKPAEKAVETAANRNTAGAPSAPIVTASLEKRAEQPPVSAPVESAASQPAPSSSAARTETEAPAKPVVRGPLKPISGGILNGKALNLPQPFYPDMARRARVMGTVEVEVVIDPSGKVISAKAVKGPIMLQQAAEQAARQARFSPTLLSGQPVKMSGVITYNFSLQ